MNNNNIFNKNINFIWNLNFKEKISDFFMQIKKQIYFINIIKIAY